MPTLFKNGKNYSGTSVSLTQAEYDALTETQKNDGTVYFITDSDAVLDASDVALGTGTVETLAGSIATIETSPATANHAVGDYIVYNGQLYKVTTAITAGATLTGKISAVSAGDELKKVNQVTVLSGDNYSIAFAKFGRLVFASGDFTFKGTNDTVISGLPIPRNATSFIARSTSTGKKIGISLLVSANGATISFYMQLGDAPVSDQIYQFNFAYISNTL